MRRFFSIFTLLMLLLFASIQNAFPESNDEFKGLISGEIETNFLNLFKVDYKLSLNNTPIVLATNGTTIYTAERESGVIASHEFNGSSLLFKDRFELDSNNKIFILDLFHSNNVLFVSYVKYFQDPEKCDHVFISSINTKNHKFEDSKNLFMSSPCLHWVYSPHWTNAGGRMASDGKYLFLTGGLVFENMYNNKYPEGSMVGLPARFEDAVKSTNLFGGITRIDLKTGKFSKIVSGLRMPQGLWWSEKRKVLFETEQGPRGGDELNIVKKGRNYGWPYVSLGRVYDNAEIQAADNVFKPIYGSHAGFEPPIFSWTPSIAVSHIVEVPATGVFSDWWSNSLIAGSLKDSSLHRLSLSKNNQVIYDERIFIGSRIRDLDIEKNFIALSTDEGSLVFLYRSSVIPEKQFPKVGSVKN